MKGENSLRKDIAGVARDFYVRYEPCTMSLQKCVLILNFFSWTLLNVCHNPVLLETGTFDRQGN